MSKTEMIGWGGLLAAAFVSAAFLSKDIELSGNVIETRGALTCKGSAQDKKYTRSWGMDTNKYDPPTLPKGAPATYNFSTGELTFNDDMCKTVAWGATVKDENGQRYSLDFRTDGFRRGQIAAATVNIGDQLSVSFKRSYLNLFLDAFKKDEVDLGPVVPNNFDVHPL